MTNEELLKELSALSREARRRIERYISFLRKAEKHEPKAVSTKSFRDEKFFGMWKDREDMKDSVAWVRKIRNEHWGAKK